MLKKGALAPDFELPNQHGEKNRLYDLLKEGPVVLFFYPKDETPGCKVEACSFRDHYDDFKASGAEIVGVSGDSEKNHASFAQNHQLPFILLSDLKKKVRDLYKVPQTLFFFPGRVTYVIGEDKKILHTFNSQWKPLEHVQKALEVLRSSGKETQ